MPEGTLKKVGGSESAGRDGAGRGGRRYQLQKPETLSPGPSQPPSLGLAGRGKAGAGVQTSSSVFKCPVALLPLLPARKQRLGVWGTQACSRGPGQAPGGVGGLQRVPAGDTQGGQLVGVDLGLRAEDKARHHPAARANGMNGL